MNKNPLADDTIVALATPQGTAAIAVIRLSGKNCVKLVDKVFRNINKPDKRLSQAKGYTIHYGEIAEADLVLDEVIVSVYRSPHSYTGEDCIEIACHGSIFIQQQIILLLIQKGARLANPGEFTLRAFLKGKIDLSQAEAVADLIASNSSTSHQVAMQQMRGGFSSRIKVLRDNLINFASLIELELDFGEEDVEFANRDDLKKLILSIQSIVHRLIESFEIGNVIKNGIPVAIVGKPNTGKSTLLNVLLEEERAIVSDIPGTTRDTIEDEITIEGVLFRFIDTAGIRTTTDTVESLGINRTWEKIRQSSIVLYVFDVHEITPKELSLIVDEIHQNLQNSSLLLIGNKIDKEDLSYTQTEFKDFPDILFISAKERLYIDDLKSKLVALFDNKAVNATETIVTNARHVQALQHTYSALTKVFDGLNNNLSGELLSIEIRGALHHLGEITGEITSDTLLENIFSRFCIGK
jgi:tRNA modification GTPase